MKYENKWLIKFMANGLGFALLLVQCGLWLYFTSLFVLGYMVFLYEFNHLIYVLEFLICIYGIPFVIIKFVIFLRDYLFRDDFIE